MPRRFGRGPSRAGFASGWRIAEKSGSRSQPINVLPRAHPSRSPISRSSATARACIGRNSTRTSLSSGSSRDDWDRPKRVVPNPVKRFPCERRGLLPPLLFAVPAIETGKINGWTPRMPGEGVGKIGWLNPAGSQALAARRPVGDAADYRLTEHWRRHRKRCFFAVASARGGRYNFAMTARVSPSKGGPPSLLPRPSTSRPK